MINKELLKAKVIPSLEKIIQEWFDKNWERILDDLNTPIFLSESTTLYMSEAAATVLASQADLYNYLEEQDLLA